jgi:DNA-directed RNA polymerase subunit RPC12/RpoP
VRGPVELARLIWQARAEASRLHRLAVDSARLRAQDDERLTEMDARIYRCPGCGEWRYLSEHRHLAGSSRTCHTCGSRRVATDRRKDSAA